MVEDSSREENVQQENGRGDEFIELEEVNELFKQQGRNDVQQGCDPEEASEFPPSTPLIKESIQNVPPQVNTNLVFGESNETYVLGENIVPRYP
ncbi:hypothetical protein ACLOJK_004950 [Asimina triloba]